VSAHRRALDAFLALASPASGDESHTRFSSEAPPSRRDTPVNVNGITVLLVDDEPIMRGGTTLLLEAHGARVLPVATGEEARALLAGGESVDVIVLDLLMPGSSGNSVLEELRAIVGGAHVPAIAFTALAPNDPAVTAARHAFDAVLSKPCAPERLFAAIEKAATRGRAYAARKG
jgi:CheY-like chemotaxis protein